MDTGAEPSLGADAGSALPDGGPAEGRALRIVPSADGELCAGACVDLEAVWPGAGQDYVYAWNQPWTGAGPHRVCPSETTRFAVDVSASPGEFATSGRAELTVVVGACDDAGRPLDDAGAGVDDAGEPATPGESGGVLCRQHFRSGPQDSAGWYAEDGNQGISTDPQGNTVVTGIFRGELRWRGGSMNSSPATEFNLFVIKLDGMCNVLWSRALPTASTAQGVAIAQQFDSDQITLLVSQRPNVHTIEYLLDEYWPYLLRLGADGKELWRSYVGADYRDERGIIGGVAVDAAGNVAMTGSRTDKIGPFFIDPASYVLRFDATGKPIGSEILSQPREALYLTTDAAGQIALAGPLSGDFEIGGRTANQAAPDGTRLVMLNAQGEYRWDRLLSQNPVGSQATVVTRGRPGHLLVAHDDPPTESGFVTIEDWTTDGQNAWKASYPSPVGFYRFLVRAAPDGRVFFLTNYRQSFSFGGKAFSRADENSQLVFGSFDANGKLLQVAEVASESLESYPAGLAVDAQNRPVVISFGQIDVSGPTSELVLTKLRN